MTEALGLAVKLKARPLSPKEIGSLARRMVDAKTKQEGDRLETQLTEGFFGDARSLA